MRNYRGMDFNSGYPDTELDLAAFQRIVTPEVCNFLQPDTSNVWAGVKFNGNLGDFAAATDAQAIVTYLLDHGVAVDINSNGGLRHSQWWAALARPGVRIGFALDGLADTHSLYRQGTDWHRVIDHARAFIEAGGVAIWRFIAFDHNLHQLEACRELAHSMKFHSFEIINDGRDTGPVFDRRGQYLHYLGKNITPHITPDIQPLLKSHLTWFDANTVKSKKDTSQLDLFCGHQRNKEIYLAADGTVYPCCYLGFYPRTMHHPGNCQIRHILGENNALEHSLEHCLSWFDRVEQSWTRSSIADGRLYACVNNCNRAQT